MQQTGCMLWFGEGCDTILSSTQAACDTVNALESDKVVQKAQGLSSWNAVCSCRGLLSTNMFMCEAMLMQNQHQLWTLWDNVMHEPAFSDSAASKDDC